jgi:hypothetical protein
LNKSWSAFATLKADGSIMAWGSPYAGGAGAPSGSGYTEIYSTGIAFAALKTDGSITVIDPSVLRAAKAIPVE